LHLSRLVDAPLSGPDIIRQPEIGRWSNMTAISLSTAEPFRRRRVEIEPVEETEIMTTDPDPFEQGQHAARQSIPAEANPYRDGSEEHSLWAAGHERVAGEAEAGEAEGT
jgi:hypothetical protein